jgi:hypothetical protein
MVGKPCHLRYIKRWGLTARNTTFEPYTPPTNPTDLGLRSSDGTPPSSTRIVLAVTFHHGQLDRLTEPRRRYTSHSPISLFSLSQVKINSMHRRYYRQDLPLGPCLLLQYFHPRKMWDMWGFGVHPILSNPLKYSSPKILYHNVEFLI